MNSPPPMSFSLWSNESGKKLLRQIEIPEDITTGNLYPEEYKCLFEAMGQSNEFDQSWLYYDSLEDNSAINFWNKAWIHWKEYFFKMMKKKKKRNFFSNKDDFCADESDTSWNTEALQLQARAICLILFSLKLGIFCDMMKKILGCQKACNEGRTLVFSLCVVCDLHFENGSNTASPTFSLSW